VAVVPGVPFVLWMQLDATGVLHDNLAVRTPHGWQTREVATGVRVRDMEPSRLLTWRVYATPAGGTAPSGIQTFVFTAGFRWRAGQPIPTRQAVQRVEVITHGRDPARIVATAASSARDVTTADGDVYVAGFPVRGR
jgi:hypothetical protein